MKELLNNRKNCGIVESTPKITEDHLPKDIPKIFKAHRHFECRGQIIFKGQLFLLCFSHELPLPDDITPEKFYDYYSLIGTASDLFAHAY